MQLQDDEEAQFIVRFRQYRMAEDHRAAVMAALHSLQQANGSDAARPVRQPWRWVDRHNMAAANPTDFGLLACRPDVVNRLKVGMASQMGVAMRGKTLVSCVVKRTCVSVQQHLASTNKHVALQNPCIGLFDPLSSFAESCHPVHVGVPAAGAGREGRTPGPAADAVAGVAATGRRQLRRGRA